LNKGALIKWLKKLATTKSKYLFKEKIDFLRAAILNSINCNDFYYYLYYLKKNANYDDLSNFLKIIPINYL